MASSFANASRARLRSHPVERGDAVAIDGDQIGDHAFGMRLALGRKIALDIELAEIEADQAVDEADGPLPARLDFGNAAQRMQLEGEVLLDERRRQIARIGTEQIVSEIGLECLDRRVAEDGGKACEKARLRHDDGRDIGAGAGSSEIGPPIFFRDQGRQRGDVGLVVGLDGIAVLHPRPLQPRKRGFKRDDVVGRGLPASLAREREQSGDMRAIGRPHAHEMRLVLQEIVAVRQAEPSLREMHDIGRRVMLIRRDVDREGNADPEPREIGEQRRQIGLVAEGVDFRKRLAQRGQARLLHTGLVHERRVEIGEFPALRMILVVRDRSLRSRCGAGLASSRAPPKTYPTRRGRRGWSSPRAICRWRIARSRPADGRRDRSRKYRCRSAVRLPPPARRAQSSRPMSIFSAWAQNRQARAVFQSSLVQAVSKGRPLPRAWSRCIPPH